MFKQNIAIRKCMKCGSSGEENHYFAHCGNDVWRCHYCTSLHTKIYEIKDEYITIRNMAWERAKGELRSILQTYWVTHRTDNTKTDNGNKEAKEKIESFIKDFEDHYI
ncbi:MAG: hypothetical protein ACOC33_00555 [bacterium]